MKYPLHKYTGVNGQKLKNYNICANNVCIQLSVQKSLWQHHGLKLALNMISILIREYSYRTASSCIRNLDPHQRVFSSDGVVLHSQSRSSSESILIRRRGLAFAISILIREYSHQTAWSCIPCG